VTVVEALARSYDYLVLDATNVAEAVLGRIAQLAPRVVVFASGDSNSALAGDMLGRLRRIGFSEVGAVSGQPLSMTAA
jgi:hypothetical protein